nr:hypothetical protein OG999_14245 [Streptomyces sp. NBC_00886]
MSASAVLAATVFAGQAGAEAHKKDNNVSLGVFHAWYGPSTPCGSGAFYTKLAQNTRWPNNTKVCATFYKKSGKR